MASPTPPVGLAPIRNYLRSFGVPDQLIEWDPERRMVRVGGHVIQPEANIEGQTYASPQVLQQAVQAVRQHLLPMPTQSPTPFAGPRPVASVLMDALAAAGQALPMFRGLLEAARDLPLTAEQTQAVASLTGRLPSGAPSFAAQSLAANLFRDLAATSGEFPGQVPEQAGMFVPLLAPFAGRQTEQRRANLADEAIRRAGLDIQRENLAFQRERLAAEESARAAERAALLQFSQEVQSGVPASEAWARAVAAGGDPGQLSSAARFFLDDPTKAVATIEGYRRRYGTDAENASAIARILAAPTRDAAISELLAKRRELLSGLLEKDMFSMEATILSNPNALNGEQRAYLRQQGIDVANRQRSLTPEQYDRLIDVYLGKAGMNVDLWRRAIGDKFPLESNPNVGEIGENRARR